MTFFDRQSNSLLPLKWEINELWIPSTFHYGTWTWLVGSEGLCPWRHAHGIKFIWITLQSRTSRNEYQKPLLHPEPISSTIDVQFSSKSLQLTYGLSKLCTVTESLCPNPEIIYVKSEFLPWNVRLHWLCRFWVQRPCFGTKLPIGVLSREI